MRSDVAPPTDGNGASTDADVIPLMRTPAGFDRFLHFS
jgi:hypothetical protein